jgi:hypothetical protein
MALTTDEIQTYGLWVQTGAIVVSAIGVVLTILWNVRIASRRATLDLVMAEQSEDGLIRERTEFIKLRDAGHLAQWADPVKSSSDESAIVRATLNRYELVAIGIRRRTLDEKLYKRWCRTTLVGDWMACKPFVMQLRQNTQAATYFNEFEALVRKWATKGERPHV